MRKKIIFLITILACINCIACKSFGQEYFTKNGSISFFSKAPIENIKADNNQVISVFNTQTGAIGFSVLNIAFHFPKAMMEQHFNSDYMESDKFPSSTFRGMITDISNIDFGKDGTYKVNVNGILFIHGVSKNIAARATIIVKEGKLSAVAVFKILLKDYHIKIPSIVVNNISENIEITVSCNYEKKSPN